MVTKMGKGIVINHKLRLIPLIADRRGILLYDVE